MRDWTFYRCKNCPCSYPAEEVKPQRAEEVKLFRWCDKHNTMVWPYDYCSQHPHILRDIREEKEAKKKYKGET